MPTDKIVYRSFRKDFNKHEKILLTPIDIFPVASSDEITSNTPVKLKALWDTGATLTVIKPKLRDMLKLRMVRANSSATIAGLGGIFNADYTVVTLRLRNNFEINWCPVYVVDYTVDVDIIIGMDIIGMGDLVISNTSKKTMFSFIMPSLPERLDLTEKAYFLNKR
jgi:hypothetical protein